MWLPLRPNSAWPGLLFAGRKDFGCLIINSDEKSGIAPQARTSGHNPAATLYVPVRGQPTGHHPHLAQALHGKVFFGREVTDALGTWPHLACSIKPAKGKGN